MAVRKNQTGATRIASELSGTAVKGAHEIGLPFPRERRVWRVGRTPRQTRVAQLGKLGIRYVQRAAGRDRSKSVVPKTFMALSHPDSDFEKLPLTIGTKNFEPAMNSQ